MALFGQRIASVPIAAALCLLLAGAAQAGSAWDDIRPAAFGDRAIQDGASVIAFKAPYRAEDQRAMPLSVETGFTDGLVRLSVGCEDLEDLRADLVRGLEAVAPSKAVR